MATNADDTTPSPATRQLRPKPNFTPQTRPSPMLREDCWSEESTHALIEAWGSHHLALSRGNLRQHHWLAVAAAVNSSGETHRRRTDVQCKNRIDTLKKKYKVEKAKNVESGGAYVSPWRFFPRLDFLISGCGGGAGGDDRQSSRKLSPETPSLPNVLTKFPVGPRSALQRKRPAAVADDSFFRNHFAAVVAAAEEVEEKEGRDREWSSPWGTASGGGGEVRREKREVEDDEDGDGFNNGCRRLAEAIMRLGEMYERVEGAKQEQLIELEKHRMQFAKDLEFQRMKLFMDTQLQLAKIKRSKGNHDADSYL